MKVLSILEASTNMLKVGLRKALECSKSLSIIKNHGDLELLILRWSVENPTSVAAGGEFGLR